MNFPIVSKPVNEGSSLGVEVCKDKKKLYRSVIKSHKKI